MTQDRAYKGDPSHRIALSVHESGYVVHSSLCIGGLRPVRASARCPRRRTRQPPVRPPRAIALCGPQKRPHTVGRSLRSHSGVMATMEQPPAAWPADSRSVQLPEWCTPTRRADHLCSLPRVNVMSILDPTATPAYGTRSVPMGGGVAASLSGRCSKPRQWPARTSSAPYAAHVHPLRAKSSVPLAPQRLSRFAPGLKWCTRSHP